jgi:hypothetical protein
MVSVIAQAPARLGLAGADAAIVLPELDGVLVEAGADEPHAPRMMAIATIAITMPELPSRVFRISAAEEWGPARLELADHADRHLLFTRLRIAASSSRLMGSPPTIRRPHLIAVTDRTSRPDGVDANAREANLALEPGRYDGCIVSTWIRARRRTSPLGP